MNIYRIILVSSIDPNDRITYLGRAEAIDGAVAKAETMGRKEKKLRDAELLKEDRRADEVYEVISAELVGPLAF